MNRIIHSKKCQHHCRSNQSSFFDFFSVRNTSSKYTSKITTDNTQNTNINKNPLTNTVNVIKILNLPTVVDPEIQ